MPLLTGTGGIIHGDNWNCIGSLSARALAVGLACSGSARGVGSVGEVGAGVLANDPGKFSQILILQIIPGTQGLYGLVAWFFALMKLGFFPGSCGY